MKLLILGATGGSGQLLVSQALDRGHEVIALVRSTSKLTTTHERLKVVQGDPLSSSDVGGQLTGCDAVLSCMGGRPGITTACDVYRATAKAVAEAMKAQSGGVDRFVAVTATGTKDVPGLPFVWRWVLKPTVMKHVVADMLAMEEYLASQECAHVNYTVVKPPRLLDTPTGEHKLQAEEGEVVQNLDSAGISRQDLAAFILDILATNEWDRKLVAVGHSKK